MAVSLKHAFSSGKADGVDATLVQPSNWNAEHTLQLATNRLLGRTSAGTGPVEEIAVTGTGSAVLSTTASIINPTVTNYTETSYTNTTGATATIDITNGTVQRFALSQNVTFSILTGAAGKSFILILTQDSSPRTVTWPVNVTWPSGTAPTISTGSGKRDIFSFFFDATTSAWLGATIGQNY